MSSHKNVLSSLYTNVIMNIGGGLQQCSLSRGLVQPTAVDSNRPGGVPVLNTKWQSGRQTGWQ